AYQVMDIGRFVSHFKAVDKKGREITVKKIQVNQYEIEHPEKVRRITYSVAETFDTPVRENPVYAMSGSSLEKNHALINTHCMLGYFQGLQDADIEIGMVYPPGWKIGTPLTFNKNNRLTATDFDFAVDSPILLGDLTQASLDVAGKKIEIYTFSKTGIVKSSGLMENMRNVFLATNKFVKGFPIDRYVLLFHFEDITAGAWEHSYSSEYVFKETEITPQIGQYLNGIAAHEIFHMITPLNLHSEITEEFNFNTPTPSQHLWLYEGVTEWASDMLQLRDSLMNLEEVLDQVRDKLLTDEQFDKSYSLQKLSLTSYTPEGLKQYPNIYYRGALVPLIMDIFLLEKTGGTRGLREVLLDLAKKYGPHKAFSEENFFNEFVSMTHPEMRTIIDKYIIHAEPLPIGEYFDKIGIQYSPEVKTGGILPDRGHTLSYNGGNFFVSEVRELSEREGLKVNDVIQEINGVQATHENFETLVPIIQGIQPGDTVTYRVQRGSESVVLKLSVGEKEAIEKHVFTIKENASPAELSLRNAWMKNFD
ncbi:MAG TPA: peptidase, partial [Cyclobacteriaceae bacterium]|nr:peptidase [Cyclobacteriaceae bacterium]